MHSPIDAETLLALRDNPPQLGRMAMERRADLFDRRTLLRPTPSWDPPSGPAILRRNQQLELNSWPAPDAWQPGDRVLIPIEPEDQPAARRYVEWLLELAEHEAREPIEQIA